MTSVAEPAEKVAPAFRFGAMVLAALVTNLVHAPAVLAGYLGWQDRMSRLDRFEQGEQAVYWVGLTECGLAVVFATAIAVCLINRRRDAAVGVAFGWLVAPAVAIGVTLAATGNLS